MENTETVSLKQTEKIFNVRVGTYFDARPNENL